MNMLTKSINPSMSLASNHDQEEKDKAAAMAIIKARGNNRGVRLFKRDEIYQALAKHVRGQDTACRVIDQIYSIGAARQTKKDPIGSIFLSGPPGTGKSFIMENLHMFLTGEQGISGMVFVDCGKLKNMQLATVQLFGAGKGIVGGEDGGKLTRGLQKRASSIILFDEFEKACPEVQETLLVALNSGFIEDEYNHVKIPCGEAFFAFTTNKNQQQIAPIIRTETDWEQRSLLLKQAYISCGWLSPEFCNRISAFLWLDQLSPDDQLAMIWNVIHGAVKDFDSSIVVRRVEPEAAVLLFEKLQTLEGGARELKRQVALSVSRDILGFRQDGLQVPAIEVRAVDGQTRAVLVN